MKNTRKKIKYNKEIMKKRKVKERKNEKGKMKNEGKIKYKMEIIKKRKKKWKNEKVKRKK